MLKWIKENKLISFLVLIVIIFSCYTRYKIIKGSLPYIGHPDEPALAKPVLRMLETGDFNPHNFVWPSLPYYLAAASFVVGYVNSVSKGQITSTQELGRVSYPFFSQKRIIFPAKLLYAFLSVIGLFLTGLTAYNFSQNKHYIYLAPLLLALSQMYLSHSARYLNTDIIGAFFAVLAIWYIITSLEIDSFLRKSIIPGILCGLTIASKYNFALVLIPSILSVLFYSKKQKLEKILLLLFITILAFIVCVPYSILDFNTFLNSIGRNIYHYKSGHSGFTGNPGLSQFAYFCQALIDEYGLGFIIFTVLGIFYSLYFSLKKGLVLLLFPLLSLIYMSTLPVRFLRNILAIYVFASIYCSFGILFILKYSSLLLKKLPPFPKKKALQEGIPALFCAAIILISLPFKEITNAYDLKPDSRNLSIRWIKSNIPYHSIIFIPYELDLDTREIENKYKINYFAGLESGGDFKGLSLGSYVFIPHYGYDPRDGKGKEISSRLNESFKNIEKIVEFGKNPVLVSSYKAVPSGNPRFWIGKIK